MLPIKLNDDQKVAKLCGITAPSAEFRIAALTPRRKKLPVLSVRLPSTIVPRVPNERTYRILFVCWGNICRSPAGENVFRHLLSESALANRIECDSAGTIDAHAGKPPDNRMRETLEQRNIPVEGAARQITREDFGDFDLILTMDDFNRQEVLSVAPDASARAKVKPFTEFCENHEASEVPDPYYGGSSGFELVADLIEDGCQGVLAHIEAQLS